MSILVGRGDGTFLPAANYTAGIAPFGIAVGDFNGDKKNDLAITNNDVKGTVSVLLNQGSGTFGAPLVYPVGGSPTAIVAGAFTGDGKLHLVSTNLFGRNLSFLRAAGSTSSTPAAPAAPPAPNPGGRTSPTPGATVNPIPTGR